MFRLFLILMISCAMALSSFAAKTNQGKPVSKTQSKPSVKTSSKKVITSQKVRTKSSKSLPAKKTASKNIKNPAKSLNALKSKYAQPSRSPASEKPTFSSIEKSQKEASQREEVSSRPINYRSPAALGDGKTLQITGQNRNLNMSLILGGKNDKVEFGEVREDYRREVIGTQY